jgi:UDP-GlcNAc3NAcA epimerase
MIEKIEKVLLQEKPEGVIVYGDTNSTIAGALAAKKLLIKVAHIEAGLRSYNMIMPEEINRILTDRISDYLFCPTGRSVENLKKEGFDSIDAKVIRSGDVMQDAAIHFGKISGENSQIIDRLNLKDNGFVLCTVHRQENTDNVGNLASIISALNKINNEVRVIVPIHPRAGKIIKNSGLKTEFTIIEPVGYFDMAELLKNTQIVITDSGGLQKEAFFFGKHCITTRTETEWTELVENGFNIITGTDPGDIYNTYKKLKDKKSDFNLNLYGNGKASEIITNELLND